MLEVNQKKAHKFLQKCLEVTERTEYNAFFQYSAHVDTISVRVCRKDIESAFKSWSVLSFTRKYDEQVLAEVLATLDSMLDGTFVMEEVNAHE